jgi:hypothetical protein
MSDFINVDGSTKLTDSEHLTAMKKWHVDNGSLTGFAKTYGLRIDPKKGPMMARAFTNKAGQQYTYNSMTSRSKNDVRRTTQEGAWESLLKEDLETLGRSDEFEEMAAEIRKGNAEWKKTVTKKNRGVDKVDQVSRGHITAMNQGGLDVPENQMIENRGLNSGRQDFDEAPEINRRMAGSPQSMTEWVHKRDLRGADPTHGLTDAVKESVLNAKNTDEIDDILQTFHGPSKLGMRRNMLRWGTAVPLAGAVIGFGQAGHAASQGDYAGAAAHTVGALVGEVPIIGDVAVESVTGSSVADGELAPNLAKVNESLKIGPEPVNLDPTGDEDFDAVAQPFLKMLQLK